jgi:hypothetical protein
MERTDAVDVLLAGFHVLSDAEKDAFSQRVQQAQMDRLTSSHDELGRFLRSIESAAAHAGCDPADLTVTQYRQAIRDGIDLEPLSRLLKRLRSWRQAREAFQLSRTKSLAVVDLRLSRRQVKAKVWRYSTETLKAFFAEAVQHYGGRVPLASELDEYRERRLEVARASGDDALHLPQTNAYRRRWGTYEEACLAMGYTPDHVAERLERASGAGRLLGDDHG